MTLYCSIHMRYSKDLAIMHANTLLLGHRQCVLWFLTNTADVIVGVLEITFILSNSLLKGVVVIAACLDQGNTHLTHCGTLIFVPCTHICLSFHYPEHFIQADLWLLTHVFHTINKFHTLQLALKLNELHCLYARLKQWLW